MKTNIAAALGSKVAIGVGATVLAFGTAGTVLALQPASDNTPQAAAVSDDTTTSTTSTTLATTTTTSTTVAPTTTTVPGSTATNSDDHGREHPDNFGAMVSEDARDGGVDGHEISEAAHERNEARRGDDHGTPGQTATDDHGSDRGHDDMATDDHGSDRGHDGNDD